MVYDIHIAVLLTFVNIKVLQSIFEDLQKMEPL
jgi:hypothetical protein